MMTVNSIRPLLLCLFLLVTGLAAGQNQAPVISQLSATADFSNNTITIDYNVADAENDDVEIFLKVSADGGQTFLVNTSSATGDVGFPVMPGAGKQIVWNYPDSLVTGDYQIKVIADDRFEIDIQTLVDAVDSNLLRDRLEFIEGIRTFNFGSAHYAAVKDTLEAHFNNAGLQTERQSIPPGPTTDGQNIIGRKPGLVDESKTYIIDAHFDSEDATPGADDNGSGVAGFLEALRVLKNYDFKHSIKFIGFDLEEYGLIGSEHFANAGIAPFMQIEGVFNFEMIGYYSDEPNSQTVPFGFDLLFPDAYAAVQADSSKGNFILSVGNDNSIAIIEKFEDCAAQYVPELRVISLEVPGTGSIAPDLRRSDHASFWDVGIPALMVTDGANFRNPNYHQPTDTIGSLNFTFMHNVVKATVAAVAELAVIMHSGSETTTVNIVNGLVSPEIPVCGFDIFPNPAADFTVLKIKECSLENTTLKIFSIDGKTVFQQELNGQSQQEVLLPIHEFGKGLFIVEFGNGQSFVRKELVIE